VIVFVCQVTTIPWCFTNGQPDRKKTAMRPSGMLKRGTLVVFVKPDTNPHYNQSDNAVFQPDRKRVDYRKYKLSTHKKRNLRDPDPVAEVYFNDRRYLPGPLRSEVTGDFITMVAPLAAISEVFWDKPQHIAVCIKDTTTIDIPIDNPTISIIAGDMVYGYVQADGAIHITPETNYKGACFQLGIAILPYTHECGNRDEAHITVSFFPEKLC
jgi:hypothetical protein